MKLILADNLLRLAVKVAPVRSPEKLALRRFINSDYINVIKNQLKHKDD